jgi:hypothetical protein
MFKPVNEQWDAFILWSLLPAGERGEVDTETAWAAKNGVTTRTLRRWKALPEFIERKAELVANGPAEASTTLPTAFPEGDEGDYRIVKSALVEGAKSGNPKYLELYFKTYGKPFVEEEAASRSIDLAGMDLEDLIGQALVAVGPDVVVGKLRDLGWQCEAP